MLLDVFGAVLWCCHDRAPWSSGPLMDLLWYCAKSHGGSLLKVLEPIVVLAASAFSRGRPPADARGPLEAGYGHGISNHDLRDCDAE